MVLGEMCGEIGGVGGFATIQRSRRCGGRFGLVGEGRGTTISGAGRSTALSG